jgi:hypothetical protein
MVRSSDHVAASSQALRNTHSPICKMTPLSSAIGMKTSGGMSPRVGCFQRSSASKPMALPVRISFCG